MGASYRHLRFNGPAAPAEGPRPACAASSCFAALAAGAPLAALGGKRGKRVSAQLELGHIVRGPTPRSRGFGGVGDGAPLWAPCAPGWAFRDDAWR